MKRLVLCALLSLPGNDRALAQPDPSRNAAHSQISIPVRVAMEDLRTALEAQMPRSEAGQRGAGIGGAVRNDVISWAFQREPLAVSGSSGTLAVTTTIGGFARISGEVQIIRGDIGRLLGKLNPTRVPFSAHVDILADATATTSPALIDGQWRIAPNFTAQAPLGRAEIPILDITRISVRDKLQPELDGKLRALEAGLNAKIAADPFLETAARRAWQDLCRNWPITIRAGGREESLFLRAEPTAMGLSGLTVDAAGLAATVGVTANLVLGERFVEPQCNPFPSAPTVASASGFRLAVPVEIAWGTLSRLVTDELKMAPIPVPGDVVSATVERIDLSDAGGRRIRADLRVTARGKGFLGWFPSVVTGTLRLSAEPVFEPTGDRKVLRFQKATFEATDDGVWERAQAGAANLLKEALPKDFADKAVIDIAQYEKTARDRAREAMRALQERRIAGEALTVAEASAPDVMIMGITVWPNALQVEVVAEGKIEVAVRPIAIGR
jgi:hypothetical protein